MMSVVLPGGNGMMMRIGFDGTASVPMLAIREEGRHARSLPKNVVCP